MRYSHQNVLCWRKYNNLFMFLYSRIKKYVNSQHSVFTNNCTSNLSHVLTPGMLDKQLSLMDTCHVVGTVHLCKYRSPVRLRTTVGKRKTSHRNHQCLFAKSKIISAFPRLVISLLLQVDWTSARVVWTRSRLPGNYLWSAPQVQICDELYTSRGNKTTFVPLTSSTMQDYWHDCQIHQLCEGSLVTKPTTCTNSLRLVTALVG
jgi:hypothetical protein